MTALYYNPFIPAFSNIGVPIAQAKLFFYYTQTSTLAPIYADGAQTLPLSNPVSANLAGKFPDIYLDSTITYRVKQTDVLGVLLGDEVDPYYPGTAVFAGDPGLRSDIASTTASKGSTIVGFLSSVTGAIGRALRLKVQETVSITDFGAVGDGSTDCTSAFNAARAWAAARSYAGNTVKIVFPAGRYIYSVSPNWAIIGLELEAQGEVWLIKTGAGPGFLLDGGDSGPGVYAMKIAGRFRIYDDAANNFGVFAQAIHNSELELDVRGCGTSFAAFHCQWLVDNDLTFTVSGNEGGLATVPAKGITLTSRGAGEDSSYNRIRMRVSGYPGNLIPLGVYCDAALGNLFDCGSVQNCAVGYRDTSNAWENKFIGTDFEANTIDAEIFSQQLQFIGCDFLIGPVFKSGAIDCKMIAGTTQNLTVNSGAINTLLSGVTYNRLRVAGTGVLSDSGTRTRMRDLTNGKTSETHNVPRAQTALTVGASPWTYTNTTGNDQTLIVYGGTVSLLALTRSAGLPMPATGQYELGPGDSMSITYSSAPAVVLWT